MKNIGEAAAKNVRVELVIPMGIGLLTVEDLPEKVRKILLFRDILLHPDSGFFQRLQSQFAGHGRKTAEKILQRFFLLRDSRTA